MKIIKKPSSFCKYRIYLVGQVACADIMIPTITPNSPRALPKISITRIFTKSVEFWASDNAQLLPMIPTHNLQDKVWPRLAYQNQFKLQGRGKWKRMKIWRYRPAYKVGESNYDSRSEDCISSSKRLRVIHLWRWDTLQLCLQYDCNNNAIYRYSFAKDYTGTTTTIKKKKKKS